jgi:hypothetical protein
MTNLTEKQIEALAKTTMTVNPLEDDVNAVLISEGTRLKVEAALKNACETPCTPHPMLGMSWWKNLGFGTACDCAEALAKQGFRYQSGYLFAGVWPHPSRD